MVHPPPPVHMDVEERGREVENGPTTSAPVDISIRILTCRLLGEHQWPDAISNVHDIVCHYCHIRYVDWIME